jgi:hypothetical protein
MAAQEVVVYVWPYKGVSHFGHASLKLKGVPGLPADQAVYMSWWPESSNAVHYTRFERGAARALPVIEKIRAKIAKKIPALSATVGGDSIPRPFSTNAVRDRDVFTDQFSEMSESAREKLSKHPDWKREGQVQKAIGIIKGYPNPPAGYAKKLNEITFGDFYLLKQANAFPVMLPGGIVTVWVQKPVKVRLPILVPFKSKCGLDSVRMCRWWEVVSASPTNRYRLLSTKQNCAGIIARVLQAGGAEFYARMPHPAFLMEPNHVHDWVLKIKERTDTLNAHPGRSLVPFSRPKYTSIWTAEQWTAKTPGSKIFGRGAEIERIGNLLSIYHVRPLQKQTDELGYKVKLRCLGDIMDCIHKYIVRHPEGRRADACLELGEQILSTIRLCAATDIHDIATVPEWVGD